MRSDFEAILVEVVDGVATITLNRPEKRNAWGWKMDQDFFDATRALDADDGVRAIVVTGAGKAFCAGADFGGDHETFTDEWIESRPGGEPSTIRYGFWKLRTPIIAAINGAAIGSGMTLPLLWDIRLAAEDAIMGFRFTPIGLIGEANSLWLLPRIVGVSRALELLISGRLFTGREAAEMGLVSRALPADELLPAAHELAHQIATGTSPLAVSLTKRLVYQFLEDSDRDESFIREGNAMRWLMVRPDRREGVDALMEKRAPVWKDSKTAELPGESAAWD